jgi:tetratricopeptide (TPR) repeat protein
LRALVAEDHGDDVEAVRAAEWVLRLDRGDPWAWIHVGELYLRLGRVPLAREAARSAVERGPDIPEAQRLAARAALAANEPEEALEAVARVRGLDVEAEAVRALAALPDPEGALARFGAWSPAQDGVLESARVALELDRPEIALERVTPLLDDASEGPDAAEVALTASLRLCDLTELHRWAAGRTALAADDRWRPVLLTIFRTAGDADVLANLMRADPDPEPYAALLMDRGRYDEALAWLGDATAAELRGRARVAAGDAPEVAWAGVAEPRRTALLADAALAHGSPTAALALTEGSTDPSTEWVRAGAFALEGRVDEAVAAARTSASGPVDAELREARVRALGGDPVGQRAALEAALGIDRCSPEANRAVADLVGTATPSDACRSASHLVRAAGIRVADADLAAAVATARTACGRSP